MPGKRARKSRYGRVLLKLSGEFLQDKRSGAPVDPSAVAYVAGRIHAAMLMKVQTAVVIGGGNIIRGAAACEEGPGRVSADYMGMLATVINAIALKSALCGMGVDARVLSAVSMDKFAELADADRAGAHLKKGRAVIYAGGTGNPFFTTDSAAALRAAEIGADALLKATKVDGIYSADPVKNRDAVRFAKLSYSDAIAKRLKVMDSSAFSICMDAGIPIVVFDFMKEGNLEKVLAGQPVGTLVS